MSYRESEELRAPAATGARGPRWLTVIAMWLPFRPFARWRWFRRACGGRWAFRLTDRKWWLVRGCPGEVDTWLVACGTVSREDYHAHREKCACEVWR